VQKNHREAKLTMFFENYARSYWGRTFHSENEMSSWQRYFESSFSRTPSPLELGSQPRKTQLTYSLQFSYGVSSV
jgi:hypothetical protein